MGSSQNIRGVIRLKGGFVLKVSDLSEACSGGSGKTDQNEVTGASTGPFMNVGGQRQTTRLKSHVFMSRMDLLDPGVPVKVQLQGPFSIRTDSCEIFFFLFGNRWM